MTRDSFGVDAETAFATVCVENQSDKPKKIRNAILLITPEVEPLGTSWEALRQEHPEVPTVESTNEIAGYQPPNPLYACGGRAVVPLPFFYEENMRIADESISYTALVETTKMAEGNVYSVRLFVSDYEHLHRTTHDAFKVGEM